MSFLVRFTTYISKISLARIQLEKEIIDRKHAEELLQKSEENFKAIAETSPLAIYMSTGIDQKAEYINPTFTKLFGYTIKDVPTAAQWRPRAYPDEKYRRQIMEEWQKKVHHAIDTHNETEPMESIVTCSDGSKKDISWGFITLGKQNWTFGLDLTERKLAEAAQFVVRGAQSKCEFNMKNDLWSVEVDPGQFNQVIGNLVINANQAMPNG